MIKQLQWNIPVNRLLFRRKKCTETKALVKGRPALMPTEWSHYRICKCMVEQWHWTNAQITPFNHKYFNINCQTLFETISKLGPLPHARPWHPGFLGMRKICILNAGNHDHTHPVSQSGQSRSCTWPITQYPIAQTSASSPKTMSSQIAELPDSFERINWLHFLFKCRLKTKTSLHGFFNADLNSFRWT